MMQYIVKGTVIPGYTEDAQGFLNLFSPVWKSLQTLSTALIANSKIIQLR